MTQNHRAQLTVSGSSTGLALSGILFVCLSCSEPTPSLAPVASVSAQPGSGSASGAAPAASASASTQTAASAAPFPSGVAATTESAAPEAAALRLDEAPRLFDADGKPLPQTEDRPGSSPAFERRMQLLFEAIVANDPSIAEPVFFPVVAYEQVKDIKKPAADWKHRLMKAFARDIGRHHKKLGPEPQACRFVGVDVDEKRVKWMERGKEGNKLGYFRVTRSTIRYTDPSGQEKKLGLTSLISWRGEWFVVHLDGFS
jgi:hypothetical protein